MIVLIVKGTGGKKDTLYKNKVNFLRDFKKIFLLLWLKNFFYFSEESGLCRFFYFIWDRAIHFYSLNNNFATRN